MSAYTTVQQRLPGSHDLSELTKMKQQLVNEMSEFTKEGDRVNPTDSQVRLAEELVHTGDRTRYVKIPFGNIVERNNRDEGSMDMMATAFDVLFRYTVNMLKLKRPRNWHTIKFTNPQFRARADCMIGTRNILKIMGYTQEAYAEGGKQNGLTYPNPSQIDHDYIKLIGAELLIAKIEIKAAQEHGTRLDPSYLPGPHDIQLENPMSERTPYNLDEMYSSNISSQHPLQGLSSQPDPPPPRGQFPSQYNSMSSNEYGNVDSYHTNPGSYLVEPLSQHHPSFQRPVSYEQSNPPQSYRKSNPPWLNSNQKFEGDSRYQYAYQPRNQGGRQDGNQDIIVEDLESHSTAYSSQTSAPAELGYPTPDSDDISAKLEKLKQKKADLKKYFDPSVPITEGSRNKPRPFTTQLATLNPQAPIPRPRKNKPSPAKPPPIREDLRPADASGVVPSTPQRPSIAPRMTRIMMECDSCFYLNHEKSLECIECSNPKNERWRKVPMPSRASNKSVEMQDSIPQADKLASVAQASTPPSSDRTTTAPNTQSINQPPSDRLSTVSNVQPNNQQTSYDHQQTGYGDQQATAAGYNNQQTTAAGYNNQQTTAAGYNNQQATAAGYNNQQTTAAGYNNQQATATSYNDQPTPRTQHNDKPTPATPSRQHGASGDNGSTGIIAQGYLPPPRYYTPEEKKMLELEARKKTDTKMQEQPQDENAKQQGEVRNFMPRNGNYNWGHQDSGGIKRPTGRAYSDKSDPDPQFYKNLGAQSQYMIHDLKEGLRRKYKLEEIQLASEIGHRYQTHCDFLQRDWSTYIERTKFRVHQLGEEFHREKRMTGSIGIPKKSEIIKALIEERGDCEKAAQRCCTNRINMIQELMRIVSLPQSAAILALERNGLNMDKAIRDVYREKMNSNALYAHIWGELEGGGIRQKQNDRVKMMINENKYTNQYLQRLLMAEYKLPTSGHCDVLIHLVREYDLTVGACLDVAKMNDKIETAVQLLRQECPICFAEHMRDEMTNLIHCDHAVCKECFVSHFSVIVGEKSIKHFNCPVCGEPDMSSETIDMDLYLQMFSGLIQAQMSKEQYNLFTQKINERTLMKDPKFLWCITCTTGFINDAGRDKVECVNPDCKQLMCFKCKKPWEAAHDGLSCEQFAEWKKDNDPELQAQGLAAYLNEEGIECPACKFKYALAKGGCMHFKCSQCPAEFCSGCGDLFKKDCTKYESCRNKGLHAHHPRDCLFYLRDESIENLQKLLQDNNVEFDVEPPEGQLMAEAKKGMQAVEGQLLAEGEEQPVVPAAAAPVLKCRVMLQKTKNADEPPIDEDCGDVVESGHAGLCLKHYKEYLVFKINQSHIDPLSLFEVGQLRAILMRDEVKVPDQQHGEGEDQYAEQLRQLIKDNIPLKERAATKNF